MMQMKFQVNCWIISYYTWLWHQLILVPLNEPAGVAAASWKYLNEFDCRKKSLQLMWRFHVIRGGAEGQIDVYMFMQLEGYKPWSPQLLVYDFAYWWELPLSKEIVQSFVVNSHHFGKSETYVDGLYSTAILSARTILLCIPFQRSWIQD